MGCDVTPVAHLAERIKAVYERAQPRDSHPMFDFDERDLIGFAEEAGFGEVHLDYVARVVWGNPPEWGDKAWTILARTAPNPQVPSLVEVVEEVLDPEEAERFLGHLKPLLEGGRRRRREARAYLWAVKGS